MLTGEVQLVVRYVKVDVSGRGLFHEGDAEDEFGVVEEGFDGFGSGLGWGLGFGMFVSLFFCLFVRLLVIDFFYLCCDLFCDRFCDYFFFLFN